MKQGHLHLTRRGAIGRGLALAGTGAIASVFGGKALASSSVATPTVVELFTSQGCSSCPPADALMGELALRDDTIALSYNVDYWDYIGWKDTLAQAAFSARAAGYVTALALAGPYTPQMVIDGKTDIAGNKKSEVLKRLKSHAESNNAQRRVSVSLALGSGALGVQIGADPLGRAAEGVVWLARIRSKVSVPVGAGENRGKTIVYTNVVRALTLAAVWNGGATSLSLPIGAAEAQHRADGLVVLVQEGPTGPIRGAAQIRL